LRHRLPELFAFDHPDQIAYCVRSDQEHQHNTITT
jgi:hypothetical protein